MANEVAARFDHLAADCVSGNEQGGILLGSYRGPHIEMVDMTFPGPMDTGTRTSFTKVDRVHQSVATKVWRASGGTRAYIGEWHTHPGSQAIPSFLDRRTWGQISAGIKHTGVFVIVAPGAWELFVTERRLHWSVKPMSRMPYGNEYVGFRCG